MHLGHLALAAFLCCIPLTAAAQAPSGKVHRIGYLGSGPPVGEQAFLEGLRERGWIEGQNILIVRRYSEGRNERFPGLAAKLIQLNVDVLVTYGTPATAAATAATTTIPIVWNSTFSLHLTSINEVEHHRLPAIYGFEQVVQVGGLIAYGPRPIDTAKRLPHYIDRVLRGTRPSDLPVEQPNRFYLAINLNAAKALGLALSPSLLLRADRVLDQ